MEENQGIEGKGSTCIILFHQGEQVYMMSTRGHGQTPTDGGSLAPGHSIAGASRVVGKLWMFIF